MTATTAPVTSSLDLIGNTPVVRLRNVVPEGHADVFLKIEIGNPTGSHKDRMARSMIEEAEKRGDLRPGMTVVEATGGSTGSALAFICALKGYKFLVVSSDAFAMEKVRTMRALGAEVELIHSPSGQITPDLIPSMMRRAQEIVDSSDNYFYANQATNNDALIGYEGIGRELLQQFPDGIDAFCGAVGGAGMVMAVSKVLKAQWPRTRVVVLEPASSPVITQGRAGTHQVDGVGLGYMPAHLNRELYDEARGIPEEEARAMCRRLAKEEGLLVGTSTGLNVVAAIALAKELGPGKTVVTLACDTGFKYMSGSLFADN
ncbi:PLP-dependent cysteine synthase family protein [Aspergillus homomorphus CBS 101889]|uniref:Pyridoxal phosphate-dependent enzyme, beta subunit n=1 Tax=Aspergillus homomorphus (strain CBS 101889) TaxID=1450537 RepID=A0A395HZB9_ASPHC|nr:pyridoxal phosphate-dependent enzyme, beta subunit [Aspergillus homomorphus CBS 101889]RAL13272.1 pyridoxal phosphate-dependent enzyme, beta subunit [Aspergillus homomorphus CBS 101889]